MTTHELARLLLAGPDAPALVLVGGDDILGPEGDFANFYGTVNGIVTTSARRVTKEDRDKMWFDASHVTLPPYDGVVVEISCGAGGP